MASILLINENKIVSRLLKLSSEKNGYEIKEVSTIDDISGSYDVVFIDSDSYSADMVKDLSTKVKCNHLGYIGAKQENSPEGFTLNLEKPFLPTDFVDMIKEKIISSTAKPLFEDEGEDDEIDVGVEELLIEDDTFELDELSTDELSLSDDIESDLDSDLDDETLLETLEDELDEELGEIDEDLDLSLDPSTMMTTGVVASMAADNAPQELSEMVNDIDSMEVDESLTELTQEKTEYDMSSIATGAGIAAVGAMATNVLSDDAPEIIEDIKEEISGLDDIDGLKESDLQTALGEEVLEEVINEEVVVDGEETLVESNDVEQWIRDAVAKAITPAMIQEALNGMDINVNLTFKSKDNSAS